MAQLAHCLAAMKSVANFLVIATKVPKVIEFPHCASNNAV